jgi:thiol:disulfide interchange protein DsbA
MQNPQNRRHFLAVVLGFLSMPALSAWAAPAAKTYERLSRPHLKENPDKIEVIEFFSYGCNHCNDFQPLIKAWAARQPADVAFRRVPVGWNAAWASLARLYYALEASGDLNRLDDAVFAALHRERQQLYSDRQIIRWYEQKGGNGKKFADLLGSFTVMSKVNQAEKLRDAMNIDSVPTLVVEGVYRVLGGSFDEQLRTADQLIAQARKK